MAAAVRHKLSLIASGALTITRITRSNAAGVHRRAARAAAVVAHRPSSPISSGASQSLPRACSREAWIVYLRAVSVELKVREVTELEVRIGVLERAQDEQRGAKTWQRA
jgi:hypothetical protein